MKLRHPFHLTEIKTIPIPLYSSPKRTSAILCTSPKKIEFVTDGKDYLVPRKVI